MKNVAFTCILFLSLSSLHAQQKLSDSSFDSGLTVNQNALLELVSKNKGLLHTKVALLSTLDATPMSNHVAGLMVYNTETRNDVVAGIYYNDGQKWVLASGGKATNITYNPLTYEMSFIDADGNEVSIDFRKVVQANETLTALSYNATTNELTYENEIGVPHTISLAVGHIAYVKESNTILYTDEVGKQTKFMLNETNLRYNTAEKKLVYLNSLGKEQVIDLPQLVGDYQTTTILKDNKDGTFTYTNEKGAEVTFDANTTKVEVAGGIYTFKDVAGNVLTTINSNAVGVIFNNDSNGFSSTNVQGAIEELLSKLKTVESREGDLAVSGGLVFTEGNNGDKKLLANTGIEIAEGGVIASKIANDAVVTAKIADKNITAEKLTAGSGAKDRIAVADAAGNVTYTNLVPNSSIVGENVTAHSERVVLGGTTKGAVLKAFSIDVDETKLVLDANQIKGGTKGQVIVADDKGIGQWESKEDVTTVLKDNKDGTFTYTNEKGAAVTFDANTTKVEVAEGIYTFKDVAGNVLTTINSNAVGVIFNNDSNGFSSTNVQGAIEELLSKLKTVESREGDLAVSGGLVFTEGNNGNKKLLANTGIEIAEGGIITSKIADGAVVTAKIADKNITAVKLGAEGVVAGYVPVAQGDGKVVYGPVSSKNIVGKNMEASDGSITIVGGVGASLTETSIEVKDAGVTTAKLAVDAVTTAKIANHTILPEDIAKSGANEMLVTDKDGLPVWKPQSELIPEVNAVNGLSVSANTVQLGGALIKPTSITTSENNTLAIAGLDKAAVQATDADDRQHLLVLGSDNVLKAVKAAMPKFFYMPSLILPTAADQITDQQKNFIEFSGETFSVNLHGLYAEQFSEGTSKTKTANQNRTTKLPVLPSTELDYYITYFDSEVYLEVKVDDAGTLTYKISPKADSTGSAYMNIVFAVKP